MIWPLDRRRGTSMLFLASRGLPLLIELGLLLYAVIDCIRTPVPRNLPKWGWLVVIIMLPFFGSLAWLLLGRPQRHPASASWGTAGYPEHGRPRAGRPLSPDDDPEFLAGLTAKREDEARLAAWEENLRRREEELRNGAGQDAPGTPPPDDAAPGAPAAG